jgi:hypothetical protein
VLLTSGFLGGGSGSDELAAAGTQTNQAATEVTSEAAAGRAGATRSAGGGSGNFREPDPVAYDRPSSRASVLLPVLLLMLLFAAPPILFGRRSRKTR